ncbi:MAG TPA: ROK family transcriptional regulator [Pyrinomonadaceae bacterium]|nr:ROK family transcriptional regulator [Pyrinomonadaceae bacterium]
MRRINLKKANVARADTIRYINRQIVLNYVREKEPISRAEISQETALQRSTVSLIVDELKQRGLIYEIEGESTGGRPPSLLRLRAAGFLGIGVDVGTAQTTIAVADLVGRVVDRERFPTDPDVRATFRRVTAGVQKFIKTYRNIEGVGVCVPGLVDPETGTALFIPHFKWRNWPLASELRKATDLPVTVDNDANAAALAELWLGRPEIRDVRDFILVLVEEGLGTGIIFDGQVYQGVAGAAGEFGHMTIGKGAPVACAAGSEECWEAFASERATLARYHQRRDGLGSGEITFLQLIDKAFTQDQAAKDALLETAYYLGLGIANLTKGLSPEAVILAGDIARAWPLISGELRSTLAANTICSGLPLAPVFASTLGDDTRLMGALSLVLASKFASVVPA